MKLFLASLANTTLDFVLPLLPVEPKHLKLAFIKTAADPYGDINMPWMQADYDKLTSLGFKITNYDIKDKSESELRKDLSSFQVIFVAGGNTFYLLSKIKESGFDVVIKELLAKNIIYIGASAGSSVMGPTLDHLTTIDHPEVVPELTDYTALSLVPHLIVPHYGRDKYAQRHAKMKEIWGDKLTFLRDNQAIIVNGDKINMLNKQAEL
jgi:dipeptidase E